jgi:alkyldihydroxyacetonephosphate synthase
MEPAAYRLFEPCGEQAAYSAICAAVGSRFVSCRGVDRLAYSRDVWLLPTKKAQRGEFPYSPEIIVWPGNTHEVSVVVRLASQHGMSVIPYGGGSGCVGGILALRESVMIDLKRMDQVSSLDETTLSVTVGAGIIVQDLEDWLNLRGYTLGHFPQSMHSASIGGCVAHNGIGTFSTKYGKFDDMVLGMEVVLPDGEVLSTMPVPKCSTGPSLNQLFLGSEGTLGIATQVTLKIHRRPECRLFRSCAVSDMRTGLDLIRQLIQHDLRPAVVRLYDEAESARKFQSLNLAGDLCLLNLCFEGYRDVVRAEVEIGEGICGAGGAKYLGTEIGQEWYDRKRFDVSAFVSWLQEPRNICDTLEVSATWDKLADVYYEVRDAMQRLGCKVMGHCSHVYPQGGNLYMIFFARAKGDGDRELEELYHTILDETFKVCGRLRAAISHHHGIGIAKGEWMPIQHGVAGMSVLRAIKKGLDPGNIMNPGKLGLEQAIP